ncbi:L,D-transpeptidase [Thermocrispum municipale]|jgi:hypothetical protein|uniref:L,D-transpeptidase n=1 Tax=Thermocrispum municipale TaxID=37926 RepID=UPI001FE10C3C|nr:L,D-transpeptidase [Thermocrispum municipale]
MSPVRSLVRKGAALLAALLVSFATVLVLTPAASAASGGYGSWPCSKTWASRACVDLSAKRAWLKYKGSSTIYGPVRIASGKPGYRTPTGTFTVKYKRKNYWSQQYDGPMPYSVFFTWQGHAFHYGSVQSGSHGCVRLTKTPARKFFFHLQVGDKIQIVP